MTEKIRVKETDVIVMRVTHDEEGHWRAAQRLHEETGALVILTTDPHFEVDTLAEESARILLDTLKQRFPDD